MAAVKPAWCAALAVLTACGTVAWAAERTPTGVQGFVADAQGAPVSGALVSVFGKGLSGGGLITFSDDDGRFSLPSLPAGSYTLRALGRGHRPALARQITVLPNKPTFFSVSLRTAALEASNLGEGIEVSAAHETPGEARDSVAEQTEALREARWMLRHRRRSVLESLAPADASEAERTSLSFGHGMHPPELGGRLEVLANAATDGDAASPSTWDRPTSLGLLRLDGRLTDSVRWSLAGLVAEAESTSWRMAAEFVVEPGGGHQIELGSGYGSGVLRPADVGRDGDSTDGGAGVLFVRDTFDLTRELSVSAGARWSYLGFLRASNYLDPSGAVTWRRGKHVLNLNATARTLAPGGDLLTLSSLAAPPVVSYAMLDVGLRAERVTRYELELTREAGAWTVGTRAFREGTRDQLVNLFDDTASGGLRIVNGRGLVSTGVGLSLGRRLGRVLSGSIDYSAGVARRAAAVDALPRRPDVDDGWFSGDARFQDMVARLETCVDRSGTRVVAFYRINLVSPEDGSARSTSTRFDVQLNQGLPFLATFTRADWELLLAFRNLFYEDSEGGLLDEIAVRNPPKRIVGGISVRF